MASDPRVFWPDRSQLYWDMVDLDSQLPEDHFARVVWVFVEGLDLGELYSAIRSRVGTPGRPATDPRVLLAVWLYATAESIGSARAVERLCAEHAAYRWLCGGVPVNYHGLSDFRSDHGALLDRVLTQSVASLAAEGLIGLEEIAVDGTKVSASANHDSFRDAAGLARYEAVAAERIQRLRAELSADPAASTRRRAAAQDRAARQVAVRAEAVRRKYRVLEEEKQRELESQGKAKTKIKDPKASTTDPDARIMKMADGAFRPAYNIAVSATSDTQVVLGVWTRDGRNDAGIAQPMIDDMAVRYGHLPKRLLIDTRAATQHDIVALAARPDGPVTVYTPPPKDKEDAKAETVRKRAWLRRKEPPAIQDWRARMDSEDGQATYRRRKVIEAVNGDFKNHGLTRFLLRGLEKVGCEVLLQAIAHNLRRGHALRRAAVSL